LRSEGHRRLLRLLINARHNAGLTQRDLANLLGRSPSFVGNYESGQRRIDVVELDAICQALGIKASTVMRRWERG